MNKLSILYGVYPWAMVCPGGGERQLFAYQKHLEAIGSVDITLYDQWDPKLEGAKIFHFFSVMPGSFQLCEYMKGLGLKLVISPNLWVTKDTMYDYPHDQIWPLINLADRIIVNSWKEAYSLAEVYGMPLDKFRVVYNGVENEYFEPVVDLSFIDKFELDVNGYLLNVANIEPRKNQLKFIEAMLDVDTELKLVIVGHIRDEEYARKVFELGRGRVIHVGPLEYGSTILKSAFTCSKAFVMPSALETPSIAALEATASGIPVLITKEGSTEEYFEGSAVFIDPNNIESMVRGLGEILSNNNKVAPLSRKYSWENVVDDLYNYYDELLNE
ncbi:glycosyltransferase [Vibrio minamisatsumaniensis]|uniref:glycosyltransferase n=1 Tax=Vibrio minamisatsumaniensis TaxID=2910243 RepID=UPI003D238F3F